MKLVDDDKDLAQELLGSSGWRIILNAVVSQKLAAHQNALYTAARRAEGTLCAVNVAKRDAIFEIIEAIYNAADCTMPENLRALKRGDNG